MKGVINYLNHPDSAKIVKFMETLLETYPMKEVKYLILKKYRHINADQICWSLDDKMWWTHQSE